MGTNEFDVEEESRLETRKVEVEGTTRTKTDADAGQAGTGSVRIGKCAAQLIVLCNTGNEWLAWDQYIVLYMSR